MKVLVLLSLVALCVSTQLTVDKRVTVWEDGTITIMGTNGREIYITKNIIDPRKVDMILISPLALPRKIEVDEINNIMNADFNTMDTIKFLENSVYHRDQVTQADILTHLFRQYEGIVDETTFQIILERIQYLVHSGLVHETIYDVLRNLEQLHLIEELKREHNMVLPEVSEVMSDKDMSENLRTLVNEYEGLKYRNFGNQGLWNVEDLTPVQRYQRYLQLIKQYPTQNLEETLNGNYLYQQQREQSQMTPLARLMYNMRNIKGQQENNEWIQQGIQHVNQQVPLLRVHELIQNKLEKQVVPEQWNQIQQQEYNRLNKQVLHQQWSKQVLPQQWNKQVLLQQWNKQVLPQQWNKQVLPQEWNKQVLPQQWKKQVLPQQWNKQVLPQQWNKQVLPQQWNKQVFSQQWNKQVLPQQWNKQFLSLMWNKQQFVPQQLNQQSLPEYGIQIPQIVGLERLVQQGQVLPQEFNMLKQYYQRMMQ